MKKLRQITKYFFRALGLILVIISLNFLLIHLMPGDPLVHILGEEEYFALSNQYPEALEEIRRDYSLDGSLPEQYARYLWQTIHLRFGNSYANGQDVVEKVLFRMKWTLLLSVTAIVISAAVGGVLGLLAGYRKGSRLDSVLTFIFLLLETIPANCLALIVLVIFSFKLRWFPMGGMSAGNLSGMARLLDTLYHMVLPVGVLSIFRTSSNFLLMKSFASQIREEEFIAVAAAKGLPRRQVLFRHLLKNVLAPYVTMLCIQFGHILSGSMLVEVVFSWKGMGTLIYDGVVSRDYPTVQLCFLLIAVCVILFNFLAEVLSLLIDPRIKEGQYEQI